MIRWLAIKLFDLLPIDLQFAIGLRFVNRYSDSYMRMRQCDLQVVKTYFNQPRVH